MSSKKGVLQECHLSVSRQGVPQADSLENVTNKYRFCSSTYVSAFGFVGFILFEGNLAEKLLFATSNQSALVSKKDSQLQYPASQLVMLQSVNLLICWLVSPSTSECVSEILERLINKRN